MEVVVAKSRVGRGVRRSAYECGPPNALDMPNPMSSIMMRRTFGASAGRLHLEPRRRRGLRASSSVIGGRLGSAIGNTVRIQLVRRLQQESASAASAADSPISMHGQYARPCVLSHRLSLSFKSIAACRLCLPNMCDLLGILHDLSPPAVCVGGPRARPACSASAFAAFISFKSIVTLLILPVNLLSRFLIVLRHRRAIVSTRHRHPRRPRSHNTACAQSALQRPSVHSRGLSRCRPCPYKGPSEANSNRTVAFPAGSALVAATVNRCRPRKL